MTDVAVSIALAPYTTLRLGGPADRLVTATTQDELVAAVRAADGDLFLLAGGSNVVVADEGLPATAVLIRTTGIEVDEVDDSTVLLTVEAGHPWDDVVAFCVANDFAGVECLSGVPGSAGATPIQNVGAYGQEVAETIRSVRVLDRATDVILDLPAAACGFAYRTSIFKGDDRYVVLAVTFALRRTPHSGALRYAELTRALNESPGAARLTEVRDTVLRLRAGKGMVLDPADLDTQSVGSFFTNPVLTPDAFAALVDRAGTNPPSWPGDDGSVKVSAAWLIEHAGFGKGYAGEHRGVAVSTKHTLALTNRGTGTTTALLGLAREIRDGVAARFGVRLSPEPVLVGCQL